MRSARVPIAEGSTNGGARGCSLESHVTSVTSVTGVTNRYKYVILKVLFGCCDVLNSTLKEVLQELRVLHVSSSRSGRYRPKLEVGLGSNRPIADAYACVQHAYVLILRNRMSFSGDRAGGCPYLLYNLKPDIIGHAGNAGSNIRT